VLRTVILYTILICLSGCRDEFVFTVPPERAYEYNLISELSPHQVVSVQLLESVPIGNALQNIDRRDATAIFSGDDVPGGSIPMAFNTTSEKYHLINEDFRVTEGKNYNVSIVIPDEKMETISATAEIPVSIDFAVDILRTERDPIDSRLSHHTVDIRLTFEEPVTLPAYYRVIPKRLVSTISINMDGNIIYKDDGETSPMEVVQILSDHNSVSRFIHREGITIDESRMTTNDIIIRLKTVEPLSDGPDVTSLEGIDALSRLHLTISTLSKEYLEYDKWVDSKLVNQGGVTSSAPRQVSNIENGSGVFAGFSRTIVTPRINL